MLDKMRLFHSWRIAAQYHYQQGDLHLTVQHQNLDLPRAVVFSLLSRRTAGAVAFSHTCLVPAAAGGSCESGDEGSPTELMGPREPEKVHERACVIVCSRPVR